MDTPMFTIAPSRLCVTAGYDWRTGWNVRISRDAHEELDASSWDYEGLSSSELVDVAAQELVRLLGLT